ncbi:MAG: hypothetical protein AAB467_01495 [Patescibacteria group bacterium]
MHPEDIRALLRKKFGNLRAFERQAGLPVDSAREVLRGRTKGRVKTAIERAIGLKNLSIASTCAKKPRIKNPDYKSQKRESHRLNEVEN